MTLQEAIELLESKLFDAEHYGDQDYTEAYRLGIEAGKRVQEQRAFPRHPLLRLLPGETKE